MDKPLTDEVYLAKIDQELAGEKRNTNLLVVLLAIICIALGCGIFYYRGLQPNLVRLCSFLLLGFVFATAIQKKRTAENASFPIITAFGIQVCIVVFCIITSRFEVAYNLAFFAAFLLPVIILQAWQQFSSIPRQLPRIWRYTKDLPQQPPFVYYEKKPVQFKIMLPEEDVVMIKSTAPGQMKLGMAFFYAVQQQDDNVRSGIHFTNEIRRPHEWIFYTVSLGRKNFLDPEESLYENGISSKATIIAECIR